MLDKVTMRLSFHRKILTYLAGAPLQKNYHQIIVILKFAISNYHGNTAPQPSKLRNSMVVPIELIFMAGFMQWSSGIANHLNTHIFMIHIIWGTLERQICLNFCICKYYTYWMSIYVDLQAFFLGGGGGCLVICSGEGWW